MKILGIDPSTKTGLAVLSFSGEVNDFRLVEQSMVKVPKGMIGMERAEHIGRKVAEVADAHNVDRCMLEGYGFGNAHSLATLVEVGTMIRHNLRISQREYVEVPPNNLKKFVTGKGNAKKDTIMMEVYKRWSITSETNDLADAIGLAMIGGAAAGFIGMPRTHMDALKTIKGLTLISQTT